MKGQFFISGVVVIAVILLVSMTYANSAEELRIYGGNDLAFENYKNAYEDAVPDDWIDTHYDSRKVIGICVDDPTSSAYFNTTVQFSVSTDCKKELYSTTPFLIEYVGGGLTSCNIVIQPSSLSLNSKNCTSLYIYYNGSMSNDIPNVGDTAGDVNGSLIDFISISTSPHSELVTNYREKNILVSETSSTNKIYNVSYKSNRIDYTGQL